MLKIGITVWNQTLLDEFLSELEANPQAFERVALISPFLNLGASSRIAKRLQHLISTLLRRGVGVDIVSDLTPSRAASFTNYLATQPRFSGFAGLYPKLHAKCGYALAKNGAHIAFLGSANLTDAALSRNQETVIAVKATPSLPQSHNLFNQIKHQADSILARSVGPSHLPISKRAPLLANN